MRDRKRVLIVDGSSVVLTFERILLGARFDIVAARDGAQAIAWAVAQPPDLILMEAAASYLSGVAACRSIRIHPRLRDVPIILVTSRDDAGCDCHDSIRKPIDAGELLGKVNRLLQP